MQESIRTMVWLALFDDSGLGSNDEMKSTGIWRMLAVIWANTNFNPTKPTYSETELEVRPKEENL